MKPKMETPWGLADFVKEKCVGVISVSTPSHGGFKVEKGMLEKVPLAWRQATFRAQGLAGWFEEDCDWCMVALSFPALFSQKTLDQAQRVFDYWIAPKLKEK